MRRHLKRNHKTEVPRRHVAFDAETIPVPVGGGGASCVHKLWLGRAVCWRWDGARATRQRWHTFRSPGGFWRWLYDQCRARESLWVWAINLGFDLNTVQVWEEIECGRLMLSASPSCGNSGNGPGGTGTKWRGVLCTEDPPTFFHVRTANGYSLKFCDVLNWVMASAQSTGESVGVSKLPMPGEGGSDEDWLAYCTRDVEIVQAAVCRLLKAVSAHDLGCFRFTLASQAMQCFRHLGGAEKIVVGHDARAKGLERLSYHGPRCEVYFAGAVTAPEVAGLGPLLGVPRGAPILPRGPVYRLDMNSAYPFAMSDNLYPVSHLSTINRITPEALFTHMAALGACADVTVDSGCEPWPYRKDGRTFWARGRFRTQLCGPELERALEGGYVKHVHKAQLYAMARPFRAFTDYMLAWRQSARTRGDRFEEDLAKRLANALHGKFAQRSHRWALLPGARSAQPWGISYSRDPQTGEVQTFRHVGWNVQKKCEGGESDDSFPLIAAYTVAYFRETMRRAVWAAGERDVLYQDADSLHVTRAGLESLRRARWIDDAAPGKFRVEHAARVAIYKGVKHYVHDGTRTCSGLGKKAVQDARGLWHQTAFLGLDALLNQGRPAGPVSVDEVRPDPEPSVPGRVNPDGWVDPLCVR